MASFVPPPPSLDSPLFPPKTPTLDKPNRILLVPASAPTTPKPTTPKRKTATNRTPQRQRTPRKSLFHTENTSKPMALTKTKIQTFEDFLALKNRPAHPMIPNICWKHWAALVKAETTKLANATSPQDFQQAFFDLCALPSDFLPRTVKTDKLLHSLLAGKPPAARTHQHEPNTDEAGRTIARCKALAAQGLLSKAARALVQAPLANISDPTVEALIRKKHPDQQQQTPERPDLPPTPPPLRNEMFDALKKMTNGTRSAVSSWTKELLRAAATVDETILEDLAVAFSVFLDGKAPPLAMRVLNLTRLVPLQKASADVRPICVSELFSKLFGAVVLSKTPPELPHWQLGFATPNGCKIAFLTVKKWALQKQTVLALDVRNAFNELCRKAIFEALQRRKSHELMLKWFFVCYGQKSDIFAQTLDGKLLFESKTGTRQGTVEGSYLFDIAFCDAVDKWASNVEKVGIADDISLTASPATLYKTCCDLVPELKKIGLEINFAKSELLAFSPLEESDFQNFHSLGIKIVNPQENVTRILGAPISDSVVLDKAFVHDKLADQVPNPLFSHPKMDPRLALTLLKACHIPKAQYLAELCDPAVTQEALAAFDTNVRNTVKKIFGSDLTDQSIASSAGLGIKPMALIAPLLHQNLLDSIAGKDVFKVDIEKFIDESFPKIENKELQAQILSQRGHNAAIWTYHVPEHFPPTKFIEAVRVRCGLPIQSTKTFCRCGLNIQRQISHPISCKYNTSYTAVHRHNDVLGAAASTARSYGFTVTVEPHCYEQEFNAQRPDILFSLGANSVACDLTIVDPTCPSTVDDAITQPGITADKAAIRKIDKHDEAVKLQGHKFYPWAFETFGHTDKRITTCLRALALELPTYLRNQFVIDMIRNMQIHIQIGNATIVNHWRISNRNFSL